MDSVIDDVLKSFMDNTQDDLIEVNVDEQDNDKMDEIDLENISSNDAIFYSLNEEQREEIIYRDKIKFLYKNFGHVLSKYLDDESVIEVALNQDGYLWIEKFGVGSVRTDSKLSTVEGNRILQLVADFNETVIKTTQPRISAVLPNGERFEGLSYSPTGFKPVFTIRKHSERIITLEEYVANGVIHEEQKKYLEDAMNGHKNILIVGGTSTGKTTFANGLLNVIKDTTDRVIVLEDTKELVCKVSNKVEMVSGDNISMKDLLVSCMRLSPTRIVLGELRRGVEAIDLLKAWNSGHSGGICTIHSNDAISGIYKLEQYLDEVVEKPQQMLIAQSVDIVVSLKKTKDYRRVLSEIIELEGFDKTNNEYKYKTIFKLEE